MNRIQKIWKCFRKNVVIWTCGIWAAPEWVLIMMDECL